MTNDEVESWRELYLSALEETDRARKLQLCAHARQVIQDRLLAIGHAGQSKFFEGRSLEEALRRLWVGERE